MSVEYDPVTGKDLSNYSVERNFLYLPQPFAFVLVEGCYQGITEIIRNLLLFPDILVVLICDVNPPGQAQDTRGYSSFGFQSSYG